MKPDTKSNLTIRASHSLIKAIDAEREREHNLLPHASLSRSAFMETLIQEALASRAAKRQKGAQS